MNVEEIRDFCIAFPATTEGFPFGEDLLVFKVNGKIFLILPLNEASVQFNAKCDPEKAIELRIEYPNNILPGYHMNKKHWNTVIIDNRLSTELLKEMITASYQLVCKRKI